MKRTVLSVLMLAGAFATAACGGGGEADANGGPIPASDQHASGDVQRALFNPQAPTSNDQQPPSNSDQSQGSLGQSSAVISCESVCSTLPARCGPRCNEETCPVLQVLAIRCPGQLSAFLQCALSVGLICQQDGDIETPEGACAQQAEALAPCIRQVSDNGNNGDQSSPPPAPGPGSGG